MPADTLLAALDKVQRVRDRKWKACCPAHDDSTPSLSITETPEGKVLIHCWAGCAPADVVEAAGVDWSTLFPYETLQRPHMRPRPRLSEIDRQIDRALGYMAQADEHQLVLDIARLMREQGVRLSDADLERERQAFVAVRRRGAR